MLSNLGEPKGLSIYCIPIERLNKNPDNTKWWWVFGATWTLVYCWWEDKMMQLFWKFLIKLSICLPYDPAVPRHLPKRNENLHSDKNLSVFITALLMISRLETTQMPFSEWMNKQTVVHPNPAMKRSGLLRYAPTWMNLKVICLNGKKSVSKDYILWYSYKYL